MMPADFLDAHHRHWDDAERLFTAQRWANADHLYGLAAECGLKALMQKLKGGPLDPKNDYVHVMESKKPSNAWARFEAYRCGHGNFDASDEGAPHYPWAVRWHRGFAALRSLHTRLESIDAREVEAVFGPLIENLALVSSKEGKGNG